MLQTNTETNGKAVVEKKWGKFLNFQQRNDKIKNAIVNTVKIYIYYVYHHLQVIIIMPMALQMQ